MPAHIKHLFQAEWCGVDSPTVGLAMHFSFTMYLKNNCTCSLTTIALWMTMMPLENTKENSGGLHYSVVLCCTVK